MLDQMAGSGTTMRAAADLQRDAIGIEIYQPHGELIRRRMSQQTMGVAVQNSAATFYYESLRFLSECNWCELTSADCPDRMEPDADSDAA